MSATPNEVGQALRQILDQTQGCHVRVQITYTGPQRDLNQWQERDNFTLRAQVRRTVQMENDYRDTAKVAQEATP